MKISAPPVIHLYLYNLVNKDILPRYLTLCGTQLIFMISCAKVCKIIRICKIVFEKI